ncbi:arrestin domain-containing protein 17-like [Dreissena polymorpha]|uniref:Arrestin C-terminal-like domain-containing protein n=1 Tax=Dreissena polymorpha TaxID=45954 RepID=A0A9D4JS64_DREPO|nr:arrestin domain-containing protein 17-like [Dreissena polymorpha]KAH3822306.1 hypothetical protein DPMN_124082 [Dreissena polymorpha]
MPNIRRLEIVLANPQIVYYSGQCVRGQVIVELNKDTKMREIRIKCRGRAYIYVDSDNQCSQEFIDNTIVLIGKPREETILPAGNYSYPFEFVLPFGIPGSLEDPIHRRGYVRYWLKATIEIPWKSDPEYKTLFTVASVLDLNTWPNVVASRVKVSDSKTVCCCCCETTPIKATLRIDKTGYVPGEWVVVNAEFQDGTGRGVAKSQICLEMLTTYRTYSGCETRSKSHCVVMKHGPVSGGGSDAWVNEQFQIPALPPSTLPGCALIFIQYFVEFKVDVVGIPFDLELAIPITIGTIPLQSTVQMYMPSMWPSPDPVVTQQPYGQPSGASLPFNLPPPSYQECMFGKVNTKEYDDRHAGGNMSYAPAYIYYNWMQPLQPSAPPMANVRESSM